MMEAAHEEGQKGYNFWGEALKMTQASIPICILILAITDSTTIERLKILCPSDNAIRYKSPQQAMLFSSHKKEDPLVLKSSILS